MNRKLRIIGGCSIAAVLLLMLLPSCAATPRRGTSLEATRAALQSRYPALLRSFDLHQGTFSVSEVEWDTLTPENRTAFLDDCMRSRQEITGRTKVRVFCDEIPLADYDGGSTVFYRSPAFAGTEGELNDQGPGGSAGLGPDSAPVLLSFTRPLYPAAALKAGIEGVVVVEARIGADGRVQEARLVDDGIAMLNVAALQAARSARFRPVGEAAADSLWVRMPMHFSIMARPSPTADRMTPAQAGSMDLSQSERLQETATIGANK